MTTTNLQIPLPFVQSWPVGLRLRSKLDAMIKPRYAYLRGTPVLVLSKPRLINEPPEWRQWIRVFRARRPEEQFGWALPEQLEVIPGQPDDPALQLGDESDLGMRIGGRHSAQPCRML